MALEHVCATRNELQLELLLSRALQPTESAREVYGLRAVLQDCGLTGTPLAADAERLYATSFESLRLLPGVEPVLRALAERYRLGIISNASGHQHAKLKYLGLEGSMDPVVLSDEAGFEKPDPRIFHLALAKCGLGPQEALFVGDRLEADIAGAKTAGMLAVWFNHWGGAPSTMQPDATITRFDELPPVVAMLAGQVEDAAERRSGT